MADNTRRLIVDSWAWFAYFKGEPSAVKVKKHIEDDGTILMTTSTTLAEIVSKIRQQGKDPAQNLQSILSLSQIVSIDATLGTEAGNIHAEVKRKVKNFSLADALVLAAARMHNAKVLTGDPDFRNIPEAIMV